MIRHTRVVAALFTIGLVVCSGGTAFVTLAAGVNPPPTPAAYYGNVTIDDEPAPAGTEITAKINGELRGNLTTESPGTFGGSSVAAEKLVVNGTRDDAGATVTFYVNDVKLNQTVEWSSGNITNIDLNAPAHAGSDDGTTDPSPPDEGDSGNNGSGGSDSPPTNDDGDGDPGEDDDGNGNDSPPTDGGGDGDTGEEGDNGGGGIAPTDDDRDGATDRSEDNDGSGDSDQEVGNRNVTTENIVTATPTTTIDDTTATTATPTAPARGNSTTTERTGATSASTDDGDSVPESSDRSGPGFGLVAAVIAVGFAVLLSRNRS
ncbi:hypothetical protein [Haloarcula sp. K1]|uniref:hypothetical protein n=1 Tax=Haloarcula sp. K1 TaxID=1622207 RepID=UPI0012BB1B52|nr:hypothetical protein [Haloarcula sp. K1]